MAMQQQRSRGWARIQEGLGVWEHRGKVAVAGVGHSPCDRRWDGTDFSKTLGAYTMLAVNLALEDAGLTKDDVDGIVLAPDALGNPWAPRPFFAPPYDSEDGLTKVSPEWLFREMGMKNVTYTALEGHIGWQLGHAAQAVGDGKTKVCLVVYPVGNIEGRYHREEDVYAEGGGQWADPWGNTKYTQHATAFEQYCRKYGSNHDRLGPFVVNNRRNGLLTPWSYYALHESTPLTLEDYLSARLVCEPLSLLDCDRPMQAAACYVFTSGEQARDLKQKPVYILSHSQNSFRPRSLVAKLEELEAWTDSAAKKAYEGSGLSPSELDIFNPYDGFAVISQYYLEAFKWHGVKRGESHDFYADDIRVEGPHPFCSGGGNNGCGRTRTALYTDSIEQLRGTAGARQVTIKAETAAAGNNLAPEVSFLVYGVSPS